MERISTPMGTLTVSNFSDDTPGDEYSVVTLDAGGSQFDLNREEAGQLIEALQSNLTRMG
ncbi:hypothetical protein HMPREF1267_02377 [Corynebacterium sp. KPL1824]|uniref:hypothetical protein n=1 Tax=Corynebacterium sp. KPL1824 TaxID=1203561 RepID=UPI0003B7F5A1|nr:hypothetical protein [Corynebacterium sp. KPL1824]ERS51256.1 hypothetical protein HMPREF1267_02377 [Corynebacterium sp. KPL1824]DAQ14474.1 MAG TPA: hypothetical protein [Caudoviricetes sp.]